MEANNKGEYDGVQKQLKWMTSLVIVLALAIGAQWYQTTKLSQRLALITPAEGESVHRVVDNSESTEKIAPAASVKQSSSIANNDRNSKTQNEWDPFAEMRKMQGEIDRMFGDAFSRFNSSPLFSSLADHGNYVPDIDLEEEENKYVVTMNVPGAKEPSIKVELTGRLLTISGQSEENKDETSDEVSGRQVMRRERFVGSFLRTITLPEAVEENKMKTDYKDGVLQITIPKLSMEETS